LTRYKENDKIIWHMCKIFFIQAYKIVDASKGGETMDDIKLLKLLRKDPNRGIEFIMDEYAGLVYAVVRGRLVGNQFVSTDIEDCVAETFSEFYISLDSFDPKRSSIRSYLCVLARNNAIDLLRRRAKDSMTLSIDADDSFIQVEDDFDIESELTERELVREIFCAIKDLGEPDASIIIRKYYFGESSAKISSALNMTVSNVDTRAHRALNKLKKLFGGEMK